MIRYVRCFLLLICVMGLSTNLLAGCSNNQSKEIESTMNTPHEKELFQAVSTNNIARVKEILTTQTVNLEARNSKGETPLMVATYKEYNTLALYLMDQGANVNAQDDRLNSPFIRRGGRKFRTCSKKFSTWC